MKPTDEAWWVRRNGRWERVSEEPPEGGMRARPRGEPRWGHEPAAAARRARARQPKPARPPRSTGTANGKPSWLLKPEPGAAPRLLDVIRSEGRSDIEVTITERAAAQILSFATARGGYTEEGGLLVGTKHRGRVLVTDGSGPGPDSKRTADLYRPDLAHDVAYLKQIEQELGGEVTELGAYHLHPSGSLQPSDQDLQSWAVQLTMVTGLAYVGLIVCIEPRSFRDEHGGHSPRSPALRAAAFVVSEGGRPSTGPWWRCKPAGLAVQGSSSWLV